MQNFREALLGDVAPKELAALPLPDSHRALTIHREEIGIFDGLPTGERDPRRTLHLDEVPVPEPDVGEALVAVMASSVNYNTVWSSIFEPVPTFLFLERYGRRSPAARRHDLPYHVLGSDLAGVVLRVGPGVQRWRPGDVVVAHCLSVELESPQGHDDTMLDPEQRIWGYETNFGGLAELALVKANQLMPKPAHLTWEEAASPGLVHSTAYRQLVSRNGANLKQGDIVLIWGACGGLGSYAVQLALNGGAIPVCVVSSADKADLCRAMGADLVIDRAAEGFRFWDGDVPDKKEWRRFRQRVRELTGGEDPDIVFEHPGRETFGASVFTAARGGTIVTCASTSGYEHHFDNRYLWMHLKKVVGTHFANYREAWAANRLVGRGLIHPTLSAAFPLEQAAEAVRMVHQNRHIGKIGVRCLAPRDGMGVSDPELRDGVAGEIELFRRWTAGPAGRPGGAAATPGHDSFPAS
ncbi:crotonyl-CoA carboxylase/reductase [Spirillospora sp. NPDC047418]|jgi:crotonyl-CoA reductase